MARSRRPEDTGPDGSRFGAVGVVGLPARRRAGLSVALFLANPGPATVTARVTSLGAQAPPAPTSLDVPAGSTVRVNLPSGDRGAATSVEFFGGWVGAGWVAFTDGGVAAEPCAPEASQRWLLADASTELGEVSSVIVANPFSSPAVLDAVLYTADSRRSASPSGPSSWSRPGGASRCSSTRGSRGSPWSR